MKSLPEIVKDNSGENEVLRSALDELSDSRVSQSSKAAELIEYWKQRAKNAEARSERLAEALKEILVIRPNEPTRLITRIATSGQWLDGVGRLLVASETNTVLELKNSHSNTWRDKPESYWFARLSQEVGELGSSLVGDHEDSPDWELNQIASICLNWLEMRSALAAAPAPNSTEPKSTDPLEELVASFGGALLEKLQTAQARYGYSGQPWMRDGWRDELIKELHKHIAKGDPRDVAAYCAFAWWHEWNVASSAPDAGELRARCEALADECELMASNEFRHPTARQAYDWIGRRIRAALGKV